MVQRDYKAPVFGVKDSRQVQRFQVSGSDTRSVEPVAVGDSQWRDRLLLDLTTKGAAVAEKAADVAFSEAYLEGQAAVGVAQSEEELQGNPLTRDWKVAGYRDSMGKLALADAQATFMQDLAELRTKGPEELQSYLSQRRQKLVPALSGMSREARTATAGQLLLQDRDATARWTAEHAKYVIEEKSRAIRTQWSVTQKNFRDVQLSAAIGATSDEAFRETLRNTAGTLVSSVWADSSLPLEIKQQLTFEMLQNALANDAEPLYEYLQDNPMPDEVMAGRANAPSTLLSRLDGDQQVKLANTYRETRNRTAAARDFLRMEQVVQMEAQIKAGTYSGTYDDLRNSLLPMAVNGSLSKERYMSILKDFVEESAKKSASGELASATLRGDINYVRSQGKDVNDGIKAIEHIMARDGFPIDRQVETWVQVGRNGITEGFRKVGEYLGVAVRQMVDSKDGTVLPQHAATFRRINAILREAENSGMSNTRVNVLSGLPESERMFVEQVLRRVDAGAGLDGAVQEAKKLQELDAGLSPSARAARAAGMARGIENAVRELTPRGLLSTGWNWVKGLMPGSTAADANVAIPESRMTSADGWFSDNPIIGMYMDRFRDEVRLSADSIASTRPSASVEEVMSAAMADVAARTIETKHGNVYLPKNFDMAKSWGIGVANQTKVGEAIGRLLPTAEKDSKWFLAFTQGRLYAQEIGADGDPIGTGKFLDPGDIRNEVSKIVNDGFIKANHAYGEGKTVKVGDVELKYGGTNTAGVSPEWMLKFRDNLVKSEGVRADVYKDVRGIKTVGVGVSERSSHYPESAKAGAPTQEDIRVSFLNASDDAAKVGYRVARGLGLDNPAGFALMSELAYQSGGPFLGRNDSVGEAYRAFATALRNRDAAKAEGLFKKTAAYKYSGDSRREHYSALIKQALKG